jgi:threonine dehydrogenase-like Zn-dependent dehydrogenase
VQAVTAGRLDPAPLFTHHFSVEDFEEAFNYALRRPAGFLKSLIWFTEDSAA